MSKNKWFVIGLMSGTSLDGVDLVYVSFEKKGDQYAYSIISSETISYSNGWETKLKNAFNEDNSYLLELDIELGKYFGNLINAFIKSNGIETVDFISSHGHTIFHKPEEGVTLQIGNGSLISQVTGIKTIFDFRTQDVALGGQGAPLVPIGDRLLFSDYEYCLNLGGFANISYEEKEVRKAFDICPVNIVMNHFSKKLGFDYDDRGQIAASGAIDSNLLNDLNGLEFYRDTTPKSLGYEFVVEYVFPLIENYQLPVNDVLRTFIAHIVDQITTKINSRGQIFVTGGGAFNTYLIHQMQMRLSNSVIVPESTLINFKEALIFAFLGVLRNENEPNCLKSVTGASKNHSSGRISEVKS